MRSFPERLVQASRLDPSLYEEVEGDQEALAQAASVVVASSLAAGVGSGGEIGLAATLLGTAAALLSWLVWALLTYVIGVKLLPAPSTRADVGQLLRTTGFSAAPGLLRVVGIVPPLRGLAFFVAGIWMLVAMIVAVKQALDYENTARAVGVCLIGFVVQAAVLVALVLVLAPTEGAS